MTANRLNSYILKTKKLTIIYYLNSCLAALINVSSFIRLISNVYKTTACSFARSECRGAYEHYVDRLADRDGHIDRQREENAFEINTGLWDSFNWSYTVYTSLYVLIASSVINCKLLNAFVVVVAVACLQQMLLLTLIKLYLCFGHTQQQQQLSALKDTVFCRPAECNAMHSHKT